MDKGKLHDAVLVVKNRVDLAFSRCEEINADENAPESYVEDIRMHLGYAESGIDKAFDILNAVNAPQKVQPFHLMNYQDCIGGGVNSFALDKTTLEGMGISASLDAAKVIQETLNENAEIELGVVDEQKLDTAIGQDTMEGFFSRIASDAVKGTVSKYEESRTLNDHALMNISFVLHIPKTATRAYAVQMMSLFGKWTNEYGYDMEGSYATMGTHDIKYSIKLTDQGYKDRREVEWEQMKGCAEGRLSKDVRIPPDDYDRNIEAYETEPKPHIDESIFSECQNDYQPHKEQSIYDSDDAFVKWFKGRFEYYADIVESAAISIKNAYDRGEGRVPNKAKINRVTKDLSYMLRVFADKAIHYGLRMLAMYMVKRCIVAKIILSMKDRDNFEIITIAEMQSINAIC